MAEDAAQGGLERDARGQLSERVAHTLVASRESWTRRMFELATQMRADQAAPVFDLSLGNPSLEPPTCWRDAVSSLLANEAAGMHRYMTNAGFAEVRAFIATREGLRYGLAFAPTDVTMTVGAAGGLNVLARATLDPGDEVVVPLPFFSEYEHYCANVGAKLVPVASRRDFGLDVEALGRALTARTRWVLLNSPNNPTGAEYRESELDALASLLADDARRRSRPLLVVEDAPYRDLVYDGGAAPSMLGRWPHTVLVTSHSKDLGLAGERIGYLVVSPDAFGRDGLVRAAAYCTRVLGFVNAPALMQRVLPIVLADPAGRVDVEVYARNCRRMAAGLRELGFGVPEPRAGFFLFPALPDRVVDDVALTEKLVAERTIVVPGTAFGVPGHLRLSLAVDEATVEGALAAFRRVCGRGAPLPPDASR
jgi:aspartate aminotransferase